jgi:hypothetical protein
MSFYYKFKESKASQDTNLVSQGLLRALSRENERSTCVSATSIVSAAREARGMFDERRRSDSDLNLTSSKAAAKCEDRGLILLTDRELEDLGPKRSTTSTVCANGTVSEPNVPSILMGVGILIANLVRLQLFMWIVTEYVVSCFQVSAPGDEHEDSFNPPPNSRPAATSSYWVHRTKAQCQAIDVACFMQTWYDAAEWSPECHIIAVVLILRLLHAHGDTNLNYNNWDKLLLCSLMLAQKVWDDSSLGNIDFPGLWNTVYPDDVIELKVVNRMERRLLELLHYDVHVKRATYMDIYFELRSLSGFDLALQPLSRDDAERLEERGAHVNAQLMPTKARLSAKNRAGQSGSFRVASTSSYTREGGQSGKFVIN